MKMLVWCWTMISKDGTHNGQLFVSVLPECIYLQFISCMFGNTFSISAFGCHRLLWHWDQVVNSAILLIFEPYSSC